MLALKLRHLHRLTGVVVSLPVLLLAVTGLLLEFTTQLQLGITGVPYQWVHRAYGIQAPDDARVQGQVAELGRRLFTPDYDLQISAPLKFATEAEGLIIAATSDRLYLIAQEPDVPIEELALPEYRNMGITPTADLLLATGSGLMVSSDFGASWIPATEDQPVTWLSVEEVPASDALKHRYRSAHINWERWLQDLHSGRFFGTIGIWVMNFAGLALIGLAITGLIVYFRTSRAKR